MIVILSLYVHCLLFNSTTVFRSFLIQLFFSDIEETLQLKQNTKKDIVGDFSIEFPIKILLETLHLPSVC